MWLAVGVSVLGSGAAHRAGRHIFAGYRATHCQWQKRCCHVEVRGSRRLGVPARHMIVAHHAFTRIGATACTTLFSAADLRNRVQQQHGRVRVESGGSNVQPVKRMWECMPGGSLERSARQDACAPNRVRFGAEWGRRRREVPATGGEVRHTEAELAGGGAADEARPAAVAAEDAVVRALGARCHAHDGGVTARCRICMHAGVTLGQARIQPELNE